MYNVNGNVEIQIQYLNKDAKKPIYATSGSAGCDLYASEDFTVPATKGSLAVSEDNLKAFETKLVNMGNGASNLTDALTALLNKVEVTTDVGFVKVPSGIAVGIPKGSNIEMELRGRSGLAFKHQLDSFNGTIDEDYTQEIHILMYNHTSKDMHFKKGDRVCQAIFKTIVQVEFVEVEGIEQVEVTNLARLVNTSIKQEERQAGIGSTGLK